MTDYTSDDADVHTKHADTATKKKLWAQIANQALKDGKSDEEAIEEANAAVVKMGPGSVLFPDRMMKATRFADALPQSYDKTQRTVDAVLSMGSPVKRFYGTEVLRIDPAAVILDRIASGGIPLLDSHNQWGINAALGRVKTAWFARGALMGRLVFNETEAGRNAEGMVARGELAGISAGYRVEEWEVTDGDGEIVDKDRLRWDDEDLTFTAVRWELLEASLVTIPADASAVVRSLSGVSNAGASATLARMRTRQRDCEKYCEALAAQPQDRRHPIGSDGLPIWPRRRRYPGYPGKSR
ncbi:MAG: HK97 family phage prohead protease [Xanthobacteraceae bacterium]|jgi:phage head maturation protease